MVLSDEKIRGYTKRIMLSRMRILCNNGFFGLLLMHVPFSLCGNNVTATACTDGMKIWFNTEFMDKLSDSELDFVMMHEISHIVLRHCFRGDNEDEWSANIAADIIVNSNILLANGMDEKSITVKCAGGVSMHKAPDGREGYEFSFEELYALLKMLVQTSSGGDGDKGDDECTGNKREDKSSGSENNDDNGNNEKSDSDSINNNEKDSEGSGEKNQNSVKVGRSKNDRNAKGNINGKQNVNNDENKIKNNDKDLSWDDHSKFGTVEEDDKLRDVWVKRMKDACEAISIRDPSGSRGLLPVFAQRILKELRQAQTDWRTILNEFVQEEIADYSFYPPDRRFDGGDFFLPDFNEKEDTVEDILFMIDTSGSISDDMITAAYSEIKGAIDQFNGRLKGWLGFFDAAIIEPEPFEDESEFEVIKPFGGGGTDFQIIFEYVSLYMTDKKPVSIIILTDGYAPFPKEELAEGIPVLWLLNNDKVKPPWGKVARIEV